jgi:hypothetical protein
MVIHVLDRHTYAFIHNFMQVDELTDEFDARRSTGYLCAATARNFEQVCCCFLSLLA